MRPLVVAGTPLRRRWGLRGGEGSLSGDLNL